MSITSHTHSNSTGKVATMFSESALMSLLLNQAIEQDLMLLAVAWLLIIGTTMVNHLSKKPTTGSAALVSSLVFVIKFIAYTIACIAAQLFTEMLVGKGHINLSSGAEVLTIAMVFFMWNWEFQGIGNNIEDKGSPKPMIFVIMQGVGKWVMFQLGRLGNRMCGIPDKKED